MWPLTASLALAAGCHDPTLPVVSCGPDGLCPPGLTCDFATDTCVDPDTDASASIDAFVPVDASTIDGSPLVIDAATPDAAPTLSNANLLVRYYLDEADTGTAPIDARDSAPNPLDLPLDYDGVLNYTEVNGHRGLRWISTGGPGKASILAAGTKIQDLVGSTAATIEAVVRVDDAPGPPLIGRFGHIGTTTDNGGWLTAGANDEGLQLAWVQPGGSAIAFQSDLQGGNRVVVHFVVDSTRTVAAERVRAYVDGVEVPPQVGANILPQDNTISVPDTAYFTLGNREQNNASFDGILFYYAIYTAPMGTTQIANNVAVLLADDDTP